MSHGSIEEAIIEIGTQALEGGFPGDPAEALYIIVLMARGEMTPDQAYAAWTDWISK